MDGDDARTIGWRLWRVRDDRGKSLRVVAGLAGMSKDTLSRIERGERSPTLNEVVALADALQISVPELTRLPVPAPANGHTDSTTTAIGFALDAIEVGHPGGLVRLAVAVVLLDVLFVLVRFWPQAPAVVTLREVLPFAACVLIYTNLHDTIGFVNPHDVHHTLAALDRVIFGVVPCVWAERFITPWRTELMQFFYVNFVWIAPSTSLLLLLRGLIVEFRAATIAVLTCFYLGYFLYVVFPAAPPRLVLVYEFTRTLGGYRSVFSNLSARIRLTTNEPRSISSEE